MQSRKIQAAPGKIGKEENEGLIFSALLDIYQFINKWQREFCWKEKHIQWQEKPDIFSYARMWKVMERYTCSWRTFVEFRGSMKHPLTEAEMRRNLSKNHYPEWLRNHTLSFNWSVHLSTWQFQWYAVCEDIERSGRRTHFRDGSIKF